MKRAIAVFFVVATGLSATHSLYAQGQRQGRGQGITPEQMKERMAAQIEETIVALELEGDRAETVRSILVAQSDKRLELQQEMFAAREGRQGQRNREGMRAMRQRMQELEEETSALLGEVLTDGELDRYAEIVASRRPRGRRGTQQIQ